MGLGMVGSGIFPLRSMALSHAVGSSSNPSRRRAHRIKSLTNSVVSSLNRLHSLSCPQTRNPSTSSNSSFAVEHIQNCARRYVSYLRCSPGSEGDDLFLSRDTSDLTTAYSSTTQALPLVADQVSLPSTTDRVELLNFLPPEVAACLTPDNLLLPVNERSSASSLFLVSSHDDYVKLVRRMYSVNMVAFTLFPKVVNGLFCVLKPDGSLRLIIDARKLNAIMAAPPSLELPNPELIAKLESDDRPVFAFKEDMKDFYHMYLTPEWLWPYMSLPAVRAVEVGLGDKYGDDTLIFPMCTTLPMGWSWACFLSQTSHKHIAYTLSSLREKDSLSTRNDNGLDRPRHLIYIDDFCGLGYDSARLMVLRDEYLTAMRKVGHMNKASKSIAPTCDGIDVIGVFFHGRDHSVGFHPTKLQLLIDRTRQLIHAGECSGKDLQRILGTWTWAFLVCRPAFAIFSAVYRFVETAGHLTFQLWPSVRVELEIAIGVAPLLVANLSAPWSKLVFCSDASSTGYGVVAANFSPDTVSAMSLTTPPVTDEERATYTLPPAFLAADWSVLVAAPWMFPDHINVLEARALGMVPNFLAGDRNCTNQRILLWSDNTVVVHATNKGRSSRFPLLRRLRAFSASVLALGLQATVRWVPSGLNPADAPSRLFGDDGARMFGKEYSSDDEGDGPGNFLIDASVGLKTQAAYSTAVKHFADWLRQEGFRLGGISALDRALAEYFLYLYFDGVEGSGRQAAANTLAGVHLRVPESRGRLHRSYLALKGWKRLVPSTPAPPFTWPVAVAVATSFLHQGLYSMAVGVLLSFDCYLRVSELCGIKGSDVADIGDPRLGGNNMMAIRLRKTKTGPNQWVTVRRVELVHMLRTLVGPPISRLFQFSPASFRYRLRKTCRALGLSQKYTPHSLRHGGATCDHLGGMALEDIMVRGRWLSSTSARRYIQSGRALLLTAQVPPSVHTLSQFVLANFRTVFALPRDH